MIETFFKISAPITVCSLITAYSSLVSLDGLFKIISGMPTFPISCRWAACRRLTISERFQPISCAINAEYSATRWECPLVYSSLASMVVERVCIICKEIFSICRLRFKSSSFWRCISMVCTFFIVRIMLMKRRINIPTPIKRPEIKTTKYVEMDSMAMASIAIIRPISTNLFFRYSFFRISRQKVRKIRKKVTARITWAPGRVSIKSAVPVRWRTRQIKKLPNAAQPR